MNTLTSFQDISSYELILNAQSGDKAALESIVTNNSGLVWSVVRRFTGRGCEAEDLFQIGNIGLIKAIRRFDTSYEVKFSTYAVPLIIGEIKRFLRDDSMIKVSRRYKEVAVCAAMARERLESKLNRCPTINEIAEETDIDARELAVILEACAPCESIYKTVSEDEGKEVYLLDKLSNASENENNFDKLSLSCAINSLSEREKLIINMRFFMDKTQCEVAKRLGISQVQVSRIEKKVLEKLKKECS